MRKHEPSKNESQRGEGRPGGMPTNEMPTDESIKRDGPKVQEGGRISQPPRHGPRADNGSD